jgi:hypothetical protein
MSFPEVPVHRLCLCEFCHIEFQPRPQVKNPRACSKVSCQQRRQRMNEKSWREQHTHLSGKDYHRIRRGQRSRKLQAVADSILKCVEVGARFLNQPLDRDLFLKFFNSFISELGIRRANKFWPEEILCDVASLG